MITCEYVTRELERNGFEPLRTFYIDSGSNHYVFESETSSQGTLIVKYPKIRSTEVLFGEHNVDTLFGGKLSLEREAYLFDLIREAGLPTPKVHGIFDSSFGKYIVLDRCPGVSHKKYLEQNGHKMSVFADSMEHLGTMFALLHRTSFSSFGDIMAQNEISPSGIFNFSDRYRALNNRIIDRCKKKECLSTAESKYVEHFFNQKFAMYHDRLDIIHSPARLVITDLHGDNFFVDEQGIPSGFFDVESSQAAPAEFELYALRFFMFNYYDQKAYAIAETSFWKGYSNSVPDTPTDELLDFFSACRLLEIFQSYWNVIDGIRDTWGIRIKQLLFTYMETAYVDYHELGAIWRERDRQPAHPVFDMGY
ncbi:MAG: phosphotransferase [Sphaerochaetaceae bacterium]|jgi:aminoglycoside phosphotransferase (APT) family kinase protein|nr:phosphotransferase [Sphaerochaetaceae bacterium]NLO61475.1 phosphotransferase [Spirochaetales bacterium]MDD2404994.1 phosphotransferase [Sphaerochaetaceae bacterium]MDD4260271.1 phosphotransferase [Sphaerochaetaceae bacterium]MDD4762502.1 phosphotransferase [Sphaerochaetaceae bacterium]